jgi:hypothetical protein
VLTLAYCLGSIILPIAGQLVNDEHWPLPESAIRCLVLKAQQSQLARLGYEYSRVIPQDVIPRHCGGLWEFDGSTNESDPPEVKNDKLQNLQIETLQTLFQLRESATLNDGAETERIKQLYERIVVLRGVVFIGLALLLLCTFAYCARVRGQPFPRLKTTIGILLALGLTIFVLRNGLDDLRNGDIFDVPVLEILIGAITIVGLALVVRGVTTRLFVRVWILVGIAFFAALAYGGWMNSEIRYDQQIISAFATGAKTSGTTMRPEAGL